MRQTNSVLHKEYLNLLDEADDARRVSDLKRCYTKLNKAVKLMPYNFEAWYKKSLIYWVNQHYISAIRALTFALRCELTEYWRYIINGFIHEILSDIDKASDCYKMANHVGDAIGSGMEAFFNLGFISLHLSDFLGGVRHFKAALKMQENFFEKQKHIYASNKSHYQFLHYQRRHNSLIATCHSNIGIAYESFLDDTKAIEHTTTAIQKYPFDYTFFKNRLKCHLRMSNFEDAIKDADSSLSLLNLKCVDPQAHRRSL
ncbi:hypothetical protein AKO1_012885 [Acrasis kona]|uniref:Uncharacterized protein n=1 Tax=Acrasis kona TaxID=1008807 RepID=A0AAW2YWU2_9EUKA